MKNNLPSDVIKLVIDTNVIISFLISKYSKEELFYKLLKQVKLGEIELFYSSETFKELLESIKIPKIQDRLNKNTSRFVADYKFMAIGVEVISKLTICRDPRDNMYLELAKEVNADFLITGDKDLLELKHFENTTILKPVDFTSKFHL